MEMDEISGREYRWKAEQYGLGHYVMQQLWKEKQSEMTIKERSQ